MVTRFNSTLDWLLFLCADFGIRIDLLLIPLDSLKKQWAGHAEWMPENGMAIEDLRNAALRAIESGVLRLMQRGLEDDIGAAQELSHSEAARLLEKTRHPRPVDRFSYLEFTQLGAIQWERKWLPDWSQFYDISFGADDAEAGIETIVLRCASWNRLGDLLSEYCRHFGYSQKPGLIDLKVTMERPWQVTYWKSLDSCYCAVFKVERGTSQSYLEGLSDRNPEISFERWKFDRPAIT